MNITTWNGNTTFNRRHVWNANRRQPCGGMPPVRLEWVPYGWYTVVHINPAFHALLLAEGVHPLVVAIAATPGHRALHELAEVLPARAPELLALRPALLLR